MSLKIDVEISGKSSTSFFFSNLTNKFFHFFLDKLVSDSLFQISEKKNQSDSLHSGKYLLS